MEKQKISKTKIEKKLKRKTNPRLVETIFKLKKTNSEIAKILCYPVKKQIKLNLGEIEKKSKGKDVLVPGKVLSDGGLTKKMKIVALKASEKAKEKIKKSGSEIILLKNEIKKNPKLNRLEVLR